MSNWQNGTLASSAGGFPLIEARDSKFRWNNPDDLHITSMMNALGLTEIGLDMNMKPTQDVLIHGEDGFIPMGDGNPSGYYSLTNLQPKDGMLKIGNQQHSITGGRIWMDRQWGDWAGIGWNWDWVFLAL
jgi:hypothetical protein